MLKKSDKHYGQIDIKNWKLNQAKCFIFPREVKWWHIYKISYRVSGGKIEMWIKCACGGHQRLWIKVWQTYRGKYKYSYNDSKYNQKATHASIWRKFIKFMYIAKVRPRLEYINHGYTGTQTSKMNWNVWKVSKGEWQNVMRRSRLQIE